MTNHPWNSDQPLLYVVAYWDLQKKEDDNSDGVTALSVNLHSEVEKEEYYTEVKVTQGKLIGLSQWKGAVWARKAEYIP